MSQFVLYSYFRSSASYRVRIALNLKGISYEYRSVHLLNNGGEQNKDEYRSLNPSGQVPTLIHQGRAIGQSLAIIDYLDRIKQDPPLFPFDPYQRAIALQACEIINSGIQPLHNLKTLQELGGRFNASEEQKNQWATDWIRNGLDVLEKFLQPMGTRFSLGGEVSAVDCFVIPHLANADRYKISLDPYPVLSMIRFNCEMMEEFKKASPANQPDTPPTA